MTEINPTVQEAWSRVMGDVQSIAKTDRNSQQGFNFRGIDAVMNQVGPALRKHGVVIVPVRVEPQWRDALTTGGKPARECLVVVTFRVIGPAGDSFEGMAPGESLDSGDKATPKAMSVAYRTFLLQSLTIPTGEPDPDSHTYERERPQQRPQPGPQQFDDGTPLTDGTRKRMFALLGDRGITDEDAQRTGMSRLLGREVESRSSLTEAEGRRVIASLEGASA